MARRAVLPSLGAQLGYTGEALSQQGEGQRRTDKVERASDKARQQFSTTRAGDTAGAGVDEALTITTRPVIITGWYILPLGSVTANDTDYARLILIARDDAGDEILSLATATTKTGSAGGATGDWPSGRIVKLIAPARRLLPRFRSIYIDIDKFGAGVALPYMAIVVEYEEAD